MKAIFIALCLFGSSAFAGVAAELRQANSPQYLEAQRNKLVLRVLNQSLKKFDLKITRIETGEWTSCGLNMEAQLNAAELSDGRICWVAVRGWGGFTTVSLFEGVFACFRGETATKGYAYEVELGDKEGAPFKKVTSKVSDRMVSQDACR